MPLDWAEIAPMIVGVVLILTVGGVMVLRPIAKRIGDLLELYARDKQAGLEGEVHQVRDLVETMNARLQLLEERQDFTDRLLTAPKDKEKTDG
ncbi:MAG: hypothetical protein LJF04_16195 [Gemmatimonadetes bacterium]|nr:hypothetical protein [Gemmatimonadota bacterium]